MFASNPLFSDLRFHVKVGERLWRSGDKVSPASSRILHPQHKKKQKPLPTSRNRGPNSISLIKMSIPISEKKHKISWPVVLPVISWFMHCIILFVSIMSSFRCLSHPAATKYTFLPIPLLHAAAASSQFLIVVSEALLISDLIRAPSFPCRSGRRSAKQAAAAGRSLLLQRLRLRAVVLFRPLFSTCH
jgi:hypothetical protein